MRYISVLLLLTVPLWASNAQEEDTMPAIAYTYQNADGNRYLPAIKTTLTTPPVDMQLEETPVWVVGGVVNGSAVWVVALADGRVFAVQVGAGTTGMAIQLGQVAPGQPIAAVFSGDGLPTLLTAGDDLSPLSHPVQLHDDRRVYVAENGDLVLWRESETLDRATDNLPLDARPVINAEGIIASYTQATAQRYVHGIMGDDIEAAALTLYNPLEDTLIPVAQVVLPGDDVFEGISPFWADLNDDGQQEIVTTVSNQADGAWLRVYNADGSIFAESEPIGQGFRWRHQLAAAPFGINGETQLSDVRTPHIGGMPEFFTLNGDALTVNNAQLGYTSHIINSRNLDMGLAGDFDGDNRPELVITTQDGTTIVALENTLAGVQPAWERPLAGTLTSNLAAVTLADGRAALAAGTDANTLRVWQSAP